MAPLRTITLAGSAPVQTTLTLAVVLDAAATGAVGTPDLSRLAAPSSTALVADLIDAAAALLRHVASIASPIHFLIGAVLAITLMAVLEFAYIALGSRQTRAHPVDPVAVELVGGQRGRLRARLYRKA
ncbi:uncharacterized protein LOC62_06G007981 [Vanrija pseudolonga]|uniref:Uncharacterized protein n=1 Tax=Vanrija pseudolonga TaxID=143232 RepID=A0AAF1BKY5_9TREE|nr:hypothetical protein LOC62_06G007981 [Vanrija pseudolonga]